MTNYSRSVLLSNGQIRGKSLRNGAWPGGKTHPQRLSFPSPERDSPGLFAHRPQTPQPSFQRGSSGTHATPAPNRAHSGSHAETGGVSGGVVSLPSIRAARSRTSPGRVSERQTLPLLRLDPVCSRKRRGPAGLRRPTPPAERTVLAPISPRVQLCLRRPAFPLSAFIPGA